MYIPHHFQNNNLDEVRDFIRKNSFGIMVNQTDGKLWATHIPLELETNIDGNEVLLGHISIANPQWKNFTNDANVLCIFSGANSYISSSWYDHENVPTWNYLAVHVYGTVKIIEGPALLFALKKLVDKYEANSPNPIKVENMSESFLNAHIKGVVGFEISINEVHSAAKLSQNRDKVNHDKIIEELNSNNDLGSTAIAQAMTEERTKNS